MSNISGGLNAARAAADVTERELRTEIAHLRQMLSQAGDSVELRACTVREAEQSRH